MCPITVMVFPFALRDESVKLEDIDEVCRSEEERMLNAAKRFLKRWK